MRVVPNMSLHPVVAEVTQRIRERSRDSRAAYLAPGVRRDLEERTRLAGSPG